MTIPKQPFNILDVTIRDGSYLINHQYRPDQVAQICAGLYQSGIQWAEVSHGSGMGSELLGTPSFANDRQLLEAVKNKAPDLKLSVLITPHLQTISLIDELHDYFELGRVGINIHQLSMARPFLERLKKYNKLSSVQLIRAHARNPDFVAHTTKRAELMGADILYLVDTYGSFTTSEVILYLEAMKANIKNAQLGFHGHNNLGLADENALAAVQTGAQWIDASLLGVGRGAGNTCLENLITALQAQNYFKEIPCDQLKQISKDIILPIFKKPPQASTVDQLGAKYKVDYAPESHFIKLAEFLGLDVEGLMKEFRLDPEFVDFNFYHLKRITEKYGKNFDEAIKLLQK